MKMRWTYETIEGGKIVKKNFEGNTEKVLKMFEILKDYKDQYGNNQYFHNKFEFFKQ